MDRRQPRVSVLGGGSWGTTVASIVARSAPTVLWRPSPEVAEEVGRRGRNTRYLRDIPLTDGLRATGSLEQAVQDADVLVMGVPSHGFRGSPRVGCVPRASLDPGRQPGQGAGTAMVIPDGAGDAPPW
jgi:glycerol-3-phosphate dehydrogenase (NAD(P)+)